MLSIMIAGAFFLFSYTSLMQCTAAEVAVIKTRNLKPYDLTLKGFREVFDADIKQYNLGRDINKRKVGIEKFKSLKPDIIFSLGAEATYLASKNIDDIPIIFSLISNPELYDLSRKNVTGVKLDIPLKERLTEYKNIMPDIKKLGVIFSSKKIGLLLGKARLILNDMQIELIAVKVSSRKGIPAAIDKIVTEADALWLIFDPFVTSSPRIVKEIIIFRALKNKMPVIGFNKWSVTTGALFCLYSDYEDIGRQAGEIARKIFREKRPADRISLIPVESPGIVKILFNEKVIDRVASNMRLNVPDKAFIWSSQ